MSWNLRLFALLTACALLAGCGGGAALRPAEGARPDSPLPASSLAAMGIDPTSWAAAMDEINQQGLKIDQIALMVDGVRVATRHRGDHDDTTLHDLRSATKSVTSLLVGMAIDRGLIASADAAVDSFFPELPPHPSRTAHRPLTLRELLTMRSGLDCDDRRDSAGNEERMYLTDHWVRFFQGIPAVAAPGSQFSYCTAGVVVLGEVVARAAGQPLADVARQWLFGPLGIHNAIWADAGAGVADAGGHLRLSLPAMLKLGELMRLRGRWQGQQIVSEAWRTQSLQPSQPMGQGLQAHMGQLWWLEPVSNGVAKSFQARGNGGQLIIVIPELKMVMAVTGHAWNEPPASQWAPFGLLERWIIPALRRRP